MTENNSLVDRELVKAMYNALKVENSLDYSDEKQRELYVKGLHGDETVLERLRDEISIREEEGVFLFSGQRGSGKSTELRRLKYLLESNPAEPCKVFYLDMELWLNPSRPMELGAFMIAVVAAWVAQTGSVSAQQTLAERVWTFFTETKVQIDKLNLEANVGVAKTGVQLALHTDDEFLKNVAEAVEANRTNFLNQLSSFVIQLKEELCPNQEKCVLLIDSLEKISGNSSNAEEVFKSVLDLFSQHTEALKLPLVHVVYSIAPFVLNQNKRLPAMLGGAVTITLPTVHVFKRNSQELDSEGVSVLQAMIACRCPEWGQFFTSDQLETLIKNSGGDLRDLFRSMQYCLIGLLSNGRPRVEDQLLKQALSQICPNRDILKEHQAWMREIAQSHHAELTEKMTALILEKYISTNHIFAYLNGETWYGVHPLLMNLIAPTSVQMPA